MAFEQKYDAATREAAVDRVLQRRATNPRDRSVLRVVSEEFNVGQQSLRAWVAAAEPAEQAPAPRRARRPRFSPVVTTKIEQDPGVQDPGVQDPAPVAAAAPAAPVAAEPVPDATPAAAAAPTVAAAGAAAPAAGSAETDAAAALEAEVAALRQGNEALKAAMRVLLGS